MAENDQSPHGQQHRTGRPDQGGHGDHRRAKGPDDLENETPAEIEAIAHDRKLQQNEPCAAGQQVDAQRSAAASARALQENRDPREEDEGRRAKVGDPPGQEQGRVAGIRSQRRLDEGGAMKEVADVVQDHQHDHKAAKHVDSFDPG
ncbi:MAG TPA: hypothetical protein VFF48_09755, partial [Brevundimonas sp.]|nr:hypothetical protein [Brevundimonas sp.]